MESKIDLFKHEQTDDHRGGHGVESEYICTREVAQRLRWSVRTIRAKIQAGVLRRNEHFFQPEGCRYLWKWSKIAEWVEGSRTASGVEPLRLFASD
jgi:hypothetical protein